MNLKVNLAGMDLEHPLFNAAGTCKKLDGKEGVIELVRSTTPAITLGSFTVEERAGNEGEVYRAENVFSMNSLGLPGPSIEQLAKLLPEMVKVAHDAGKPVIVSVAGFTPAEFAQLSEAAFAAGADAVEENLGCPNVWDGGAQKGIASFSPEATHEIFEEVEGAVGVDARILVKLSPFSNPADLSQVASVIREHQLVKAVVTCNTFANAYATDENGDPWISPGGGLAGMAGPALKPIGMGQVKQFRAQLPERIQIVGVGGIRSGQDVLDYLRAGADAVAVATSLVNEGPGVFSRILTEYVGLVESGEN